ncbi:MAG: BatA domain-containing protein [Thermoguttaceae bacterium]|nr:BatA domain-containing protein [Thermoguttaceae bacterium]MDW8039083.1 BatA and WFA domain-containing protein [Thermoguttaceae bacterium]
MTFLAPLFLLATLAAVIPVILHLINRQRAKDLPFPTLRFLRIAAQKTRRRRRIQDLFLLVVRMAALILIALGLAKPTVTKLGSLLGAGSSTGVMIILDNSASMGAVDGERVRFETALGAARQILDQLRDGDYVGLFLTGGPQFPEEGKLAQSPDKVIQMLNQAAPSYERADLAVHVRDARKALAKLDVRNKLIYVLTDLQANSWEGYEAQPEGTRLEDLDQEQQKELKIPVVIVDCHQAPKPNVAIQRVTAEAAVPVAGVPIKADVLLYNASSAPQQRHLELYIDGVRDQTSPAIEIPAEGTKEFSFQFRFRTGGRHRCEVRLVGEDGSSMDDRYFFAMEVNQNIPIAIVKAQAHEITYLNDTFYLEKAFMPSGAESWAIKPRVLTLTELGSENLSQYLAIFLVNVPAPSAGLVERLREYVEHGGNLIWICGENVRPAEYNAMNEQAQSRLLPAPLLDVQEPAPGSGRESWFISTLDREHKTMKLFLEPATLYQSVLVYKYVRIDERAPEAGGLRVLARLDDGQPIFVERPVERGRVYFWGTSVHVGWTNLPLKPLFLPLFVRLCFDMLGVEQAQASLLAGHPIVVHLDDPQRPTIVEVVPPSGQRDQLQTIDTQTGTPLAEVRFKHTYEPGIYTVKLLGGPQPKERWYSVNVDPEEANTTKIDRAELEKRFSPAGLLFAENPEDLSSTFKLLHEGESLWETFLTAVLLVLVFETFVSNYFSPKQEEEQLQYLGPYAARRGRRPAPLAAS